MMGDGLYLTKVFNLFQRMSILVAYIKLFLEPSGAEQFTIANSYDAWFSGYRAKCVKGQLLLVQGSNYQTYFYFDENSLLLFCLPYLRCILVSLGQTSYRPNHRFPQFDRFSVKITKSSVRFARVHFFGCHHRQIP